MAIVFSDNFDSYPVSFLPPPWTSAGAGVQMGGCTSGGKFLGCTTGSPRVPFDTGLTNKVSIRVQTAINYQTATTGNNLMFVHFPGINATCSFTYQLGAEMDGRLTFAMSDTGSVITSPTAGLIPVNGTLVGLQLRIESTGSYSCNFAVDINNITVWSGPFEWSVYAIAPCASGGVFPTNFNRVTLFPRNTPIGGAGGLLYQAAFDNLEVDNDNAKINWPASPTVFAGPCGIPVIIVRPPGSGLYRIVPAKRQDTLWGSGDAETHDEKIPHPFLKTGPLGE